jgi:hypothetical protein
LIFAIVIGCALVMWPRSSRAQGNLAPVQIGANSPLPVFVTNTPSLPDGFAAGSRWRFTTWTMPSVLTWTATVERTSGAWAYLTVRPEDGSTHSRWYYIPAMQGSWEPQ